MNDRIAELMVQAGITTNLETDLFDDEGNIGKWLDHFAEEFAELIVQEMCRVMKAEVEEFDLDQNFSAVQGVGRCIKVVKQHFGVE